MEGLHSAVAQSLGNCFKANSQGNSATSHKYLAGSALSRDPGPRAHAQSILSDVRLEY